MNQKDIYANFKETYIQVMIKIKNSEIKQSLLKWRSVTFVIYIVWIRLEIEFWKSWTIYYTSFWRHCDSCRGDRGDGGGYHFRILLSKIDHSASMILRWEDLERRVRYRTSRIHIKSRTDKSIGVWIGQLLS